MESAGAWFALQTVLDNCIMLMIMPPRLLSLSFAPESWQRVGSAAASFKAHMARMLDEEISALKKGSSGSGGLMTSFVRAMDLKQHEDAKGGKSGKGLSLDEIFGNIFVINFAGHDTTANTLAFATLLLAAHPHVQEWVTEELQQVVPENPEGGYEELFPKLKRSKAVMVRLPDPLLTILNETPCTIVGNSPSLPAHHGPPQMDKGSTTEPAIRRQHGCHPPKYRGDA